MSTFGSIWPKRSNTPLMPKSGEQEDHTAPRLVVASNGDDGLMAVGHEARHPVAGLHAALAQRVGAASHLLVESPIGERDTLAILATEYQGRPLVPVAQQVLGEG